MFFDLEIKLKNIINELVYLKHFINFYKVLFVCG